MVKIQEIEVKSVMTKSNLPVADFSVNPYVGCLHGCKYCYAAGGQGAVCPCGGHPPTPSGELAGF